MAKKNTEKMVHCRYPKCRELHDTTELKKTDAVQGGSKNSYYHPDCWNTMQTVNGIRDLFYKEINPEMTGKQIGQLVSIVNHLIFNKNVDPNFIKFALQYYIKYKPGSLKFPAGITYIIQNKDVVSSWKNEQLRKIRQEIKEQAQAVKIDDEFQLDVDENTFTYKPPKTIGFADILH